MAVGGAWTVSLDAIPPVTLLPEVVLTFTKGEYPIVSTSRAVKPEYMLVQDTHDGACWLWSFADGLKFIESIEPVVKTELGLDDSEKSRLLEP